MSRGAGRSSVHYKRRGEYAGIVEGSGRGCKKPTLFGFFLLCLLLLTGCAPPSALAPTPVTQADATDALSSPTAPLTVTSTITPTPPITESYMLREVSEAEWVTEWERVRNGYPAYSLIALGQEMRLRFPEASWRDAVGWDLLYGP